MWIGVGIHDMSLEYLSFSCTTSKRYRYVQRRSTTDFRSPKWHPVGAMYAKYDTR